MKTKVDQKFFALEEPTNVEKEYLERVKIRLTI